jgi:Beta-lactamase
VYVKEQLGHASIQMTVDTYGHLIPGANRAAVDRLDDVGMRPSATQAQPEPFSDAATIAEKAELFEKKVVPNVRQLEPVRRLAQTARHAATGGVSVRNMIGCGDGWAFGSSFEALDRRGRNMTPRMNRVLTILIAIALPMCPSREGTLGASGVHAGVSQPGSAQQSARMDALLAPWNTRDGPGAAVMVIHNGQVLHTKGYGLANRTRREPFRPDTASLIGSMAKQFTAMAIMLLAESGQLSYDDPLSRYFADLAPPTRRITIRWRCTTIKACAM